MSPKFTNALNSGHGTPRPGAPLGRFSLRLSPEFLSVDRAAPDLCCFLHKSFLFRWTMLTLLRATPEHLRNYFSSIPLFSGIFPCWLLARKPRCFWFASGWATRRERHGASASVGDWEWHCVEEAEQIKKLITDLTSTVEVLDADIAADEKRPNVHRLSRENRRNIMVTIGTLQDRLFSIEHTVS